MPLASCSCSDLTACLALNAACADAREVADLLHRLAGEILLHRRRFHLRRTRDGVDGRTALREPIHGIRQSRCFRDVNLGRHHVEPVRRRLARRRVGLRRLVANLLRVELVSPYSAGPPSRSPLPVLGGIMATSLGSLMRSAADSAFPATDCSIAEARRVGVVARYILH